MKAIRIHEPGDADALIYDDVPAPEPGPGQARVRLEAVGLNFIDIYHRRGLYPAPRPFIPGMEGAGVVDALGAGVTGVAVGERVAYTMVIGSYADYALVPAVKLAPVPAAVSTEQAAAVALQGMTAHYLALSTYPLKPGDTALVHAAAGGVGLLLVQIAKLCGARVIGTVSTAEKEELARGAGADEVIRYTEVDFEAEVKHLTGGRGVEVVYDSVGQTTFDKSLNCLKPRGMIALFGASSGPVPPFDAQILNQKGSLFLTRPSLGHYILDRQELLWRMGDLFKWMAAADLHVRVDRTFPLAQAADAHRYMEARKTKGKVLLIP